MQTSYSYTFVSEQVRDNKSGKMKEKKLTIENKNGKVCGEYVEKVDNKVVRKQKIDNTNLKKLKSTKQTKH